MHSVVFHASTGNVYVLGTTKIFGIYRFLQNYSQMHIYRVCLYAFFKTKQNVVWLPNKFDVHFFDYISTSSIKLCN